MTAMVRSVHVVEETQDDLVGERRFAGPAGAGDADDRWIVFVGQRPDRFDQAVESGNLAGLDLLNGGDEPGDHHLVGAVQVVDIEAVKRQGREVEQTDHVIGHPLQTHRRPILGGIDLGHAIGLELLDLVSDDNPASAPEHLDMGGLLLAQEVDHVFERLHMPALVTGHGDALGVLFDRGFDQFLNGAVMGEMDHLDAAVLQDPADDIGGDVVAVKERGGGDDPDTVFRSGDGGFGTHMLSLGQEKFEEMTGFAEPVAVPS